MNKFREEFKKIKNLRAERKPSATKKSESSAINCEEKEARIAQVAYDLYEKGGRVDGRDWQDWFEAQKIVGSQSQGCTCLDKG